MRWPIAFLIVGQTLFQIALHLVPFLDRYVDIAGMGANYGPNRRYFGVLYNAFDNFSYAAWAEQARQGSVLFSDLYTTEPHLAAFFNPYFLTMGWLSALCDSAPLIVMSVVGIGMIPVLGWLMSLLCAEVSLPPKPRCLAVLLTLFATGPSAMLGPVRWCLAALGTGITVPSGIDGDYYDLFPSTAFVSLPYHTVALTLTAAVFLLAIRTLKAPVGAGRRKHVVSCAFAIAFLILVRPFQAGVLGLLFPVALALSGMISGQRRIDWTGDFVMTVAILLPPVLYIGGMSQLDVWNYLSKGYRMIEVNGWQVATGFSLFWIGSAMGCRRALRERNTLMLLPCLWFAGTVLATLVLGKAMTKFADGAVLAYAILTAYGLEPVFFANTADNRAGRARTPGATLAVFCIALAVGTTLLDDAQIVHSVTPEADEEVLAIAQRLRAAAPHATPLVLTNCDQGLILPAFARVRVYSGHWGLTVDYAAKCRELRGAGFDLGETDGMQNAAFTALLGKTAPDYLVVSVSSPADRWSAGREDARRVWSGQRWRLVDLRSHAATTEHNPYHSR
jgi:hypothetical protein